MIRVYLDWNVFSYLKSRNETEEIYKILYAITKSKTDFLYPYSPAHLQDLMRSYHKSDRAKKMTYEDLDFITEITNSHCLCEDFKEKGVAPRFIDPKEYFEEMLGNELLENFDFENVMEDGDSPIQGIWNSYVDLLKAMPSGVNLEDIDKLSSKYQKIKDLFVFSRENNSIFSMIKDITNVITSIEQHSDTYKTIRNSSIDDLKIDTDPKNWGNPFDYLNKFIKKSKIDKTFEEVLIESFKNNDKPLYRFDSFLQYYISLDMFGFHRDARLSNLMDDATHAYYGAYCDFFLTEDDNTYHKAKAIYEKFGIETVVCKVSDFSTELGKLYSLEQPEKIGFLARLKEVMKSSLVIANGLDDENNNASIFKIENHLLAYFNRMQITNKPDRDTLHFYKRRKNYSTFMFLIELETITNKISTELGIDENKRLEFNQDEKNEIIEDKWLGRIWAFENLLMVLYYQPEPFGLTFQIEIVK